MENNSAALEHVNISNPVTCFELTGQVFVLYVSTTLYNCLGGVMSYVLACVRLILLSECILNELN